MKRIKDITCCFSKNSLSDNEISSLVLTLKSELEKQILSGYTNFICGGDIGFDMLCAEQVAEIKT